MFYIMLFPRKNKGKSNFDTLRQRMVEKQLINRKISDNNVLEAMCKVPRHLFVPERYQSEAYDDGPLSIGYDQTISQPYMVASMTEHLELDNNSRVLEIGTGCGYQTAVLAEIAQTVYSIEVIRPLYEETFERLKQFNYSNIFLKYGDGSSGWPEYGPYDAIIITAAAPRIPELLVEQLKIGGRMVLPLGDTNEGYQILIKLVKTKKGLEQTTLYAVRFVPMVGMIAEE